MNARSHKSKSDAIPEQARDWWLCFTQWDGKPGRCGPYTQYEAEHRMRSTHWRPGSAPRYERSGK